ncbi:MAG: cyclic nucleotide-binding domain-containing protein [Deltaproteobacteria bacterium]|nr:cyclic nucleotide-binding domain-containing protein [Deltaproteobacteria bacterium]
MTRRHADGLDGQWLSLEEVAELDFFKSSKRAKLKLPTLLGAAPDAGEPGIKAVVRREYEPGEVICEAGAYGSTAFLLVEGAATAFLPERVEAKSVEGRTPRSLARILDGFRRRTRRAERTPGRPEVGEVSRYATLAHDRRLGPAAIRPGEIFGLDTCVNFYPREATVRAETRCVALEMLRSVLDTIRGAGDAIDEAYEAHAIRSTLHQSALLAELSASQIEALAAVSTLLTPDSDEVSDGVVYAEDTPADALYLVRAGTIKMSQTKAGGEFVFTYLGRGGAFGFEALMPARPRTRLVLRCASHPTLFRELALTKPITIGRSESCDMLVPKESRAIGRRHCRVEERDGELWIVDLDSANHTLLNGERIREAILAEGDHIGVVEYVFEIGREDVTAVDAPAAVRVARASGLDSFEVVRVPAEALGRLAEANAAALAAATRAGRALETAAFSRSANEQAMLEETVELNLYNSQNVLLIDLERCTRCDECVRACADAHDGVARFTRDGPRIGRYLVTMACRSCTDPKCMVGCPVGSIRREDSLEIKIEDWCIGCERCANQCPFGNINMVELSELKRPPPPREGVSLRATVCDLCAGYDGPNCVYACPHDAAIRVAPGEFLAPSDLR